MDIKKCKQCGSERRMILKTGYTQCLDCHNERTRLWSREHKGKKTWNKTPQSKIYRRNWQLMDRYGLAWEEYSAILEKQGGICAICGGSANGKSEEFCVDHDHETGQIRGLLCNKCNVGLANFRDRSDLLCKAADYLEEHR